MKKRAYLYLVPFLILLMGCGSDRKAGPAGQEPVSGGDQGVPVTQLPSLPSREGSRPAEEARDQAPSELPLGTREKLPFRTLPKPVLPEDRSLGPLGGGEEDRPVLTALKPLMEALSQGKKPDTALLSGRVKEGQELYWERFFLDFPAGDYRYRLGTVNYYAPGAASVNCRFFLPLPDGERAAAAGEFLFENQEGAWKVAGLHLNREDLENPYQVPAEPFEPQVYRWLQLY